MQNYFRKENQPRKEKKNTGKREKEESVLSQAGEQKSYKRVRAPPDEGRLTSITVRVKWVEANTFLYKIKACTHTHTKRNLFHTVAAFFFFAVVVFRRWKHEQFCTKKPTQKKRERFVRKYGHQVFPTTVIREASSFPASLLYVNPSFSQFSTLTHTHTARQSTH